MKDDLQALLSDLSKNPKVTPESDDANLEAEKSRFAEILRCTETQDEYFLSIATCAIIARAEAEAQRDELAALLREVQRWLKRGGSSTVAGRIDAALAKLDPPPCERCEGKGEVVMPEEGGVTRWMAPCPNCKPLA